MRHSYKLTHFPVGSLREIMTVSCPLILGLLSNSLMMFADRLFLANYSLETLSASATGGMAAILISILPLVIAGMSEVFVGRLNGEESKLEIGKSVWQMIWFSVATGPFFIILPRLLTPLIFYGSPLIEAEADYFIITSDLNMFWCICIALMGFYIGIGKAKFVMWITLAGNGLNILLDYWLIFGIGPFPEMGIRGAALATGIASFFMMLMLGAGFLSSKNHGLYRSRDYRFHFSLFKEGINIGIPAGLGRFMEMFAHMIFLRAVAFSGAENLTIVAIVQSIYILFAFCTEGLSKAVTAIISNLIGAGKLMRIGKVLRAAIFQHILIFSILMGSLYFFSHEVIGIFLPKDQAYLLLDTNFFYSTIYAINWMCIFFLFDGFCWILMGHLLAAQDTRFLLIASLAQNWVANIIPTLIGMLYLGWGAKEAWIILGFSAFLNTLLLLSRFLTGNWRKKSLEQELIFAENQEK